MKKLLFLLLIMTGCHSDEHVGKHLSTVCNPLDIEYRLADGDVLRRDIGSPCVVLFRDEYYLFATNAKGYYRSSDLVRWDTVPTNLPSDAIAPTVMEMDGELYFMSSFKTDTIYRTNRPETGMWEIATDSFPYADLSQPMLFCNDDKKVYLYASTGNPAVLVGVEINPDTWCPTDTLKPLVKGNRMKNGWEKPGDYNEWEVTDPTWIDEGWMTKHGGRYYLQYASPGSYLKSSNDAVYVSDHPLGPFLPAAHNPYAYKPEGFVAGIGYGCVFSDRYGNYWHVGTVPLATKTLFEGRLALHPAFFDKDSLLYVYTGWGDYPMYIPEKKVESPEEFFPGWMLLSYAKPVQASSELRKHPAECANDENIRSFWSAQSNEEGEYLSVDVGERCHACAVQVSFADYELDSCRSGDERCYQVRIEASADGRRWTTVADYADNRREATHCYIPFARPVRKRYFRIVNLRCPTSKFSLLEFRIFGKSEKALPGKTAIYIADRDSTDRRTVFLKWKPAPDALGYNIRYGSAPDKMYHNYILYDDTELTIRSLQADRSYYFTIDSFNEGGITCGEKQSLIK